MPINITSIQHQPREWQNAKAGDGREAEPLVESFPLDALDAQPRSRDPEAPRLRQHPRFPDILVDDTPDGPDYIQICVVHQWASLPLPMFPRRSCPLCEAMREAEAGYRRYAIVRGLRQPHREEEERR